MESSILVGKYLKEFNTELFNSKEIIGFNGKDVYSGEFYLHKIMYLANIFHLLVFEEELIPTSDFLNWENGLVNIRLINPSNEDNIEISNETKVFLKKITIFFSDSKPDELYEIIQSDIAYKNTSLNESINIKKFINFYKEEYAEAIKEFKNL
ncbi:hypothetical protein SCLARK_00892 [Spiroplasma clarkii]|uniref:Antitoxin SocA-like Panacea domain-containing protein n=1 Tax=Spiroplasma clarkii TaxID=2139 RepID=A0A1Y0L0K0_9MOLU|nr:hypothetical protein [Spiroplasma clarkii]ARU91503.1 hypothetical protein SCLARK_00892 [Spiroplasma clarkii]ATX70918.1 hypothetical protein SCLAR_v1c05990 [Spiroplasma clarkii]